METEKKRKKGGADYLKERYVALQKECEYLKARGDEYLADYQKAIGWCADKDARINWFLSVSPFWVRWMYEKHFSKEGGN